MSPALWVALLTAITEAMKFVGKAKDEGSLPEAKGVFGIALKAFRAQQILLGQRFEQEIKDELAARETKRRG